MKILRSRMVSGKGKFRADASGKKMSAVKGKFLVDAKGKKRATSEEYYSGAVVVELARLWVK